MHERILRDFTGGANGVERQRRLPRVGGASGGLVRGVAERPRAVAGLRRLGGGRRGSPRSFVLWSRSRRTEKRGGGAWAAAFDEGGHGRRERAGVGFASTLGQPGPGGTAPAGAGFCRRRHRERREREMTGGARGSVREGVRAGLLLSGVGLAQGIPFSPFSL